jgi:beta-galactosidase
VYFDKHQEGTYGLVKSRDLVHWEDVSDQISFPDLARHGSVLRVDFALVEALMGLEVAASE